MRAEINQRESIIVQLNDVAKNKNVLMAEMNALKEKLASKEMAMEKLGSEFKFLTEESMMCKNDLSANMEKMKGIRSAYNKVISENETLKDDMEVVTAKYNRAKYMYESEKKRNK